jgi:hypothetical protein
MKIIQLPIEYLWLSLDYDDRLIDQLYDYDVPKMTETIFIEHPECLTSEDTASGAGASNDRTPKFYNILEKVTPVSELMHEFIFFPTPESVNAFKDYFDYMKVASYLNDGNPDLIEKRLINPENPLENEQPIYVIDYGSQYGDKQIRGYNQSANQIATENTTRSAPANINIADYDVTMNAALGVYEIKNVDDDNYTIIPIILNLLQQGNFVLYNPTHKPGYDPRYFDEITSKIDVYKHLDFVFAPEIKTFGMTSFFKPLIKSNQPMLFGPTNNILIKFLQMFVTLEHFSDYLNGGSYEFFSRVRVGYSFIKKRRIPVGDGPGASSSSSAFEVQGEGAGAGAGPYIGGGEENDENNVDIDEYTKGLEAMYGGFKRFPKRRSTHKRRGSNKSKKNTRRRK